MQMSDIISFYFNRNIPCSFEIRQQGVGASHLKKARSLRTIIWL